MDPHIETIMMRYDDEKITPSRKVTSNDSLYEGRSMPSYLSKFTPQNVY